LIISRIYQGQGFGNQLWCIFTAYALAKKKRYSLGFLDPNNLFLGSSIFSFSKKLFFNRLFVKKKYYEKGYYHKNLNTYLFRVKKVCIINFYIFSKIFNLHNSISTHNLRKSSGL
jgi:hypothetical protein